VGVLEPVPFGEGSIAELQAEAAVLQLDRSMQTWMGLPSTLAWAALLHSRGRALQCVCGFCDSQFLVPIDHATV
jgi:hypothetical protein